MIDFLLVPIAVVYLAVVVVLFIFGLNFLYLTFVSLRNRRDLVNPIEPEVWPSVTVQLPVYNERYVVERLIRHAALLEYPSDKLEIQILDDSTDDTSQIIEREIHYWLARGVNIHHIRREDRRGFKAGALGAAFAGAHGEYLAIFDADFLPPPDFLKLAIPYFGTGGKDEETQIAFIQTRWAHINADYSLLTWLQSLAIDAHFMVEQYARSQGGYWFNFNGTAGIWCREAIEAVGGWKADTLTEDLDLSYRAFLNGWKAVYVREICVPAELPISFTAYRCQQHRWAKGSFECAKRFLPQVWATPISWTKKLQASLHLLGYSVHLLLFALSLLYPLVLWVSSRYPGLVSLFGIAFLFNVSAFSPTIFFIVAQQQLKANWWRKIPGILFASVMGSGMMLNTLRAFLQLLYAKPQGFERTPKFGIESRGQRWTSKSYQIQFDHLVFFELFMGSLNAFTVALAIHLHIWVIAIYAGIFSIGLFFNSGLTIFQAMALYKQSRSLVKR